MKRLDADTAAPISEPTAAAIVRQALPTYKRKLDQTRRLLDIRAYRDAERTLREASDALLRLAIKIGEGT